MSPSPVRAVGNVAAAVYGAVVATALAAGLSLDRELTPGRAALALAGSCTAFCIAHVYAEGVHARHAAGRWLHPAEVAAIAHHEAPQLAACLPCVAVLLAGAVGAVGHDAAFDYAPWAGVASLFALGVAFGLREQVGVLGALGSGVVDAVLGAAVVALKVALAH